MGEFQHHSPDLRLYWGENALASLPRELDRLGCRRAVVFCGATLSTAGSALDRVKDALGLRCAGVFAQVRGHSPLDSVEAGAQCIAAHRADSVVALGGGSCIVTARAAGIVAAEGRAPHSLSTRMEPDGQLTSPRLTAAKLPQFVVPTTPTTAIAKAGSAVHDTVSGERLALFDPKTRARAVFVDPSLLQSAPLSLVQAAALNAFAMAVEGLESASTNPWSDAALMHALRLLADHLPGGSAAGDEAFARTQLVLAAILCGQGSDVAGGGLASVLGHAIGRHSGVPNGIVNAMVLPHTMRFNFPATHPRLWKIVAALPTAGPPDGDVTHRAIAAVEATLAPLALPAGLRHLGFRREQFDDMVTHAQSDVFLQRNPRPVESRDQLVGLLGNCW